MLKRQINYLLVACILVLSGCATMPRDHSLVKAGDTAFAEGDYTTASDFYSQAAQLQPRDSEISFKLGESYFLMNAFEEAKPHYELAAANNEYLIPAKKRLGRIFLCLGESQNALLAFKSIVDSAPQKQDYDAINGMGVSYDLLGKHEQAQECYLKNLAQVPNDINSKSNLGLSKAFSKKYTEAIEILEPIGVSLEATKQQRHNLALAYALGNLPEKCHTFLDGEVDQEQIERFMKVLQSMGPTEVIAEASDSEKDKHCA